MALSAAAVLHAKGRQQPYKLTDSPGLVLLVNPDGRKYWRYNYRFDGKQKTMTLGVYPDISLAEAREKRDAARKLVVSGIDPMKQRKEAEREKRVREQETFKAIAEEWLERLELQGRAAATLKKNRWLMEFSYPRLGDRPIAEITATDLLEVLRKIEVRVLIVAEK
ncbi:Arm DNA-binding domain-containing protein [Sphingosinicella sp.]|uniref:tyrosine-type recombinase/integrase n=1 Tax=Sphingosinicella sp. TaxID=1917971 RepID=UPI0026224EC2|nr:Arm DNA-binding domain-containing protein [Sphingosinicella sp.]